MNRTVKVVSITGGLLLVLALLAILCSVWLYERLAAPSNELQNQLQTMIKTHDTAEMKALSIDDATDKFLTSMPKNVSITASDFQGGGNPHPGVIIGYFPARIDD